MPPPSKSSRRPSSRCAAQSGGHPCPRRLGPPPAHASRPHVCLPSASPLHLVLPWLPPTVHTGHMQRRPRLRRCSLCRHRGERGGAGGAGGRPAGGGPRVDDHQPRHALPTKPGDRTAGGGRGARPRRGACHYSHPRRWALSQGPGWARGPGWGDQEWPAALCWLPGHGPVGTPQLGRLQKWQRGQTASTAPAACHLCGTHARHTCPSTTCPTTTLQGCRTWA